VTDRSINEPSAGGIESPLTLDAAVARLRTIAHEIAAVRKGLAEAHEIDAESPESPWLVVAAELVASAAGGLEDLLSLDAPPAPDAGKQRDERIELLTVLRPRLRQVVGDVLADLSTPELRALAAHPDDEAALVLVVALAARGRSASGSIDQPPAP